MTMQDVVNKAKASMIEHSIMEDHDKDDFSIVFWDGVFSVKVEHPTGEILTEKIPREVIQEALTDALLSVILEKA